MLRMLEPKEIKERQQKILKWIEEYLKTEKGYKLENMLYQLKDLLEEGI